MSERSVDDLPVVVVTSVIRSTYQGQSHGGVYLVDLDSGKSEQVLDWDEAAIDWEGRGGDRGLRGVAFSEGQVFLAASDEVFVYDRNFALQRSIARNPYLKHCHEIAISDGVLWLTSAGHDSVLGYHLATDRYVRGYELRYQALARAERGARKRLPDSLARLLPAVRPRFRVFDPNGSDGPDRGDTTHINSVTAAGDDIWICGTQLRRLYQIHGNAIREHAIVPGGTHNAQPFGADVILNDTVANEVAVVRTDGRTVARMRVPMYATDRLEAVELAGGNARQGFGRGLAVWRDRYAIGGSSPATVTVHDLETGEPVTSVNLTTDVRNAIHGLEIWPYQPPNAR